MKESQEIETEQKKLDFEMKNDVQMYSDSGNRFCENFYVELISSIFLTFFFILIQ